LLFLMYAEQRGMMASRDSLYTDEYSITNLREKAETRRSGSDRNTDLWHGLQSTFRLVEKGDEELGVPCYNGMLFDSDRLNWVSESECSNDDLLDAIEYLTLIEHEGTRQRISYADLGVEEIGSVYESLLEFTPRLATEVIELEDRTVSRGEFYLDERGTERKETGSYYTDPSLVQELVQSALKPVVENRLENATTTAEKEDALLDISVCDPASGSGAFLIAANNFLAQRLARIRSESDYPPEDQIRQARRAVLQHCIYAVDLNPMAVELAKVSLWINSAVEDKPLNFLNHHIKCGNSLIGTNSELLEGEFPVDAYETGGGRDWHVGNEIRKRIRNENKERAKGSSESSLQQWGAGKEEYVDIAEQLDLIEEEDTTDLKKKKKLYDDLRESQAFQQEKLAYDIWTAAFYWPMDGSASKYPSPSTIEKIRRNPNPDNEALQDLVDRATKIAEQQRFFHWELEFPEVFGQSSSGFDCILGNPPWDVHQAEERSWFLARDKSIASAPPSKRKEKIEALEEENPELFAEWEEYQNRIESDNEFMNDSGRFDLTSKGKLNLYSLFTEHSRDIINSQGRVGIVVQSGIVTDYYNRDFFKDLIEKQQLHSLYDFENRERLFPGIDNRMKFSLLTLTGGSSPVEETQYAFYLTNTDQLHSDGKVFSLSKKEIELINPNTKTSPVFRTRRDANLTKKIYVEQPVLVNKQDDEISSPWDISFKQGLFNATSDSEHFHTKEELLEANSEIELRGDNRFMSSQTSHLPVYEGKMVETYNHRSARIKQTDNVNRSAQPESVEPDLLKNPNFVPEPQYWIEEKEVLQRIPDHWDHEWTATFKRVTSATNHRTVVGPFVPYSAIEYTLIPMYPSTENLNKTICLFANIWSFVFDYVVRQKTSQTSLPMYVIEQAPALPPSEYNINDIEFIVPRVLELTYTSWDHSAFADDIWQEADGDLQEAIMARWKQNRDVNNGGNNGAEAPEWLSRDVDADEQFPKPPFMWNEERREKIRAELDAYIANLYDLEEEELEFLLDSFEVIKKNELNEHGEYRTKKLIMSIFNGDSENMFTGDNHE